MYDWRRSSINCMRCDEQVLSPPQSRDSKSSPRLQSAHMVRPCYHDKKHIQKIKNNTGMCCQKILIFFANRRIFFKIPFDRPFELLLIEWDFDDFCCFHIVFLEIDCAMQSMALADPIINKIINIRVNNYQINQVRIHR